MACVHLLLSYQVIVCEELTRNILMAFLVSELNM